MAQMIDFKAFKTALAEAFPTYDVVLGAKNDVLNNTIAIALQDIDILQADDEVQIIGDVTYQLAIKTNFYFDFKRLIDEFGAFDMAYLGYNDKTNSYDYLFSVSLYGQNGLYSEVDYGE
jgi:hypothetical protein